MDITDLITIGRGNFSVESNYDGTYYVNFYFELRKGDDRRETMFDGLTRSQADDLVRRLKTAQRSVYSAISKYRSFIYE